MLNALPCILVPSAVATPSPLLPNNQTILVCVHHRPGRWRTRGTRLRNQLRASPSSSYTSSGRRRWGWVVGCRVLAAIVFGEAEVSRSSEEHIMCTSVAHPLFPQGSPHCKHPQLSQTISSSRNIGISRMEAAPCPWGSASSGGHLLYSLPVPYASRCPSQERRLEAGASSWGGQSPARPPPPAQERRLEEGASCWAGTVSGRGGAAKRSSIDSFAQVRFRWAG